MSVLAAVALAVAGPGSSLFVPPVAPEARAYWPTREWRTRDPAAAGLDPAALRRAEEYAFPTRSADDDRSGIRTDGLLIVKDGHLVFERYAGGFTAGRRHLFWSCAKSLTNALAGIAVAEGRVELDAPAHRYYPALLRGDHRAITIDHLLRMSAGLYANETYEASPLESTVMAMLFSDGRRDMAGFAAAQPLEAAPGSTWEYSSLVSNLLQGVLRRTIGDAEYADYPWTRLFEPLGIASAVWERDAAGTFVGSSYAYLTPRDAARFGFLFLNDGVWDGRRLLPVGWVRYSTTVAPAFASTERREGSYGAHWWLNRAVPEWKVARPLPSAPEDLFFAAGHWGQYVAVVPSLDMVVVVTGDQRDGSFDLDHFFGLLLAGARR